jgi:uncharacterized membrane-anchored protein YhcB (DUF1043 family)
VITSINVVSINKALRKENTLDSQSHQAPNEASEDIQDYVAQLQLHMALQARNLVPSLSQAKDSREELLQETQATVEKMTSRQVIGSVPLWQTDFCRLEQ